MGQYYLLVNVDKEEFICPWCMHGVAKAWEWCANNYIRVLAFLICHSDEEGGGDPHKDYEYYGRWAYDRIVLIGDYDSSGLFDKADKEYRNITRDVLREFNDFMGSVDLMIPYRPCLCHEVRGTIQYKNCPKCGRGLYYFETLDRRFFYCFECHEEVKVSG